MLYRYRLFTREDGEAHYAVAINPDEIIFTGDGRKLRVVEVVPTEDDSALCGDADGRASVGAAAADMEQPLEPFVLD